MSIHWNHLQVSPDTLRQKYIAFLLSKGLQGTMNLYGANRNELITHATSLINKFIVDFMHELDDAELKLIHKDPDRFYDDMVEEVIELNALRRIKSNQENHNV